MPELDAARLPTPEKVDNFLVHQSQIFQVKNNAVISGFLTEKRFQLTHIVCVHSTAEIKYPSSPTTLVIFSIFAPQ